MKILITTMFFFIILIQRNVYLWRSFGGGGSPQKVQLRIEVRFTWSMMYCHFDLICLYTRQVYVKTRSYALVVFHCASLNSNLREALNHNGDIWESFLWCTAVQLGPIWEDLHVFVRVCHFDTSTDLIALFMQLGQFFAEPTLLSQNAKSKVLGVYWADIWLWFIKWYTRALTHVPWTPSPAF